MLQKGILNPSINSLLSRVRHTNLLLISDSRFPSMNGVEIVDISLVENTPRVLDVVAAIRPNFKCGRAYLAEEFRNVSSPSLLRNYEEHLAEVQMVWEPQVLFKARAQGVVGVIRTGDTTRFGNIIIESA